MGVACAIDRNRTDAPTENDAIYVVGFFFLYFWYSRDSSKFKAVAHTHLKGNQMLI